MAEDLRALIQNGFSSVDQRFMDLVTSNADRHGEVVRRLDRIERDADKTAVLAQANSLKVTAHDSDIKTLFKAERGELNRLKWYIFCFVGGVSTVLGALRLFGKL